MGDPTKAIQSVDPVAAQQAAAPIEQMKPANHGAVPDVDSTQSVRLLLRRARTTANLHASPTRQQLDALLTAEDMTNVIDTVVAQSKLGKINWAAVDDELALFVAQAHAAVIVVAPFNKDQSVSLQARLIQLASVAGSAMTSGTAIDLPAIKPAGEVELVRLQIASAREEASKIATANLKDEAEAARLCVPLHLYLHQAKVAALALERSLKLGFIPDLEALAKAMEKLGAALSADPKLAWKREFAEAFDAENGLRQVVGLNRIERPYFGELDPATAVDDVKKMTKAESSSVAPGQHKEPAAAVGAIGVRLRGIDERQISKLEHFAAVMSEKEETPWWAGLLEFAVTTALNAITAGVAGSIGKAIENSMKNAAAVSISQVTKGLAKDEVAALSKTLTESSAIKIAMAVDTFKDATKNVIKGAAQKGNQLLANPSSTSGLHRYQEFVVHGLSVKRDDQQANFKDLIPALSQLPLGALNDLEIELNALPDVAAGMAWLHAVEQWENVRARAASGTKENNDVNLDGEHAPYAAHPIPWDGVLEIGLSIDPDPAKKRSSTLAFMVLRGGEPAARQALRQAKQPVGTLALNRQYQLSFDVSSAASNYYGSPFATSYVNVGVTDKGVLESGTINDEEKTLLRLYIAGNSTGDSARLLRRGMDEADEIKIALEPDEKKREKLRAKMAFDRQASEKDAMNALRALVDFANEQNTSELDS